VPALRAALESGKNTTGTFNRSEHLSEMARYLCREMRWDFIGLCN